MSARLIICSKSTWEPAVRREHALAGLARAAGHPVRFLERPLDVRALRSPAGARAWAGALTGRAARGTAGGVVVDPTAVLVPGHRGPWAERQEVALLARRLRRLGPRPGDTVMFTTPWQWPAAAGLPDGVRRVFDCADDWGSLMPAQRARFTRRHEEIARTADAVVLVTDASRPLFAGADVTVVRNGVDPELVAAPRRAPAAERALVYVGTLSPRFDAPLVGRLLEHLPGWRLDLHGPCQYPGHGDAPDAELAALLAGDGRVTWHGVAPRRRLGEVLDRASVGLLPNRRAFSGGQDAMKLYDYSARGLPAVSTAWGDPTAVLGPPGLRCADTPAALAVAVQAAAAAPAAEREAARGWAREQVWPARWPAWATALFGLHDTLT